MQFLRRIFSSVWFNLFSVLLTFGLLVLLGFWHRAELTRKAEDYRRTMDELSYVWYERFNLPFLVFDELFTPPQKLGATEEIQLIMRRWRFWTQQSEYPDLVKVILRIQANPIQSQVQSPGQIEAHSVKPDYQAKAADWVSLVNGLAARLSVGTLPNQRHALIIIDTIPYLVINYGQASYYVLVLDKQEFYYQFIEQITQQTLPKIRATLPGFSPAILNITDKPQIYYCPDHDIQLSKMYIMYSLDDRLELENHTGMPLGKDLSNALRDLQMEASYFVKMWLTRVPSNDSFSSQIVEASVDSPAARHGIFFAFLPKQGEIETLVFVKVLPVFALGYGAVALMGLSLLMAALYNRKMLHLMVRQEEFVATMTHELRTPLHIITNGASNLADGIVSTKADVARYGKLLHSEASRLSDMIESILNFADVTNRRPVFHVIDIHSLVDELMASYRMICREQQIQIDEQISGLPGCLGDPEAIRLILSNLLSNAINHAGSGKWIGVSIVADSLLTITVQDHGPGIPKRDIPKITDPFFRGSRPGKNRIQGNGLGLSIVKRLTEAEQGSLEISSEEGKGSYFVVKLPYQIRGAEAHV